MQLEEMWYSTICVLDLWICLYLCIWGSAAASTPNQGTVGMFTPSSLFFLEGRGLYLLVHMVGFGFFSVKRTSIRGETGLTKRTWNWPKTCGYFLASEKEQNVLLLKIVIFSLFPEHMLSWAAVSWEPFCYWGNTLNVSYHLFIKEPRNILSDFFPS